ncbi:hypothetical protein DFH09DRAFT_1297458, partial [Mycena vulgaris]
MAVLAADILTRLLAHPPLAKTLQFQQIQRFLEFTRHIWPEIVGKSGVCPVSLPPHPAAFLSSMLELPLHIISLSWLAFSDFAAIFQQDPVAPSLEDGFRLHADDRISAEPLLPPVTNCIRATCNHTALGKPIIPDARLYTLHRGALPVFSKSLYCHSCCTRYFPNYFVQGAENTTARREYYESTVPRFIHVTTASFVEPELCVYFEMQMAMTHSSADGIARI